MKYFLAVVLPPIAVLACGKPFQAMLNCGLCLLVWIPAVIHALCVVSSHERERFLQRLISVKALRQK